MGNTYIAIMLTIILILILIFSTIFRKNIGLVAFIMTLVWSGQVLVILILTDTKIMNLEGVIWITAFNILYNVGSFFGISYISKKKLNIKHKYVINNIICRRILIASILIGVLFSVISLKNTGFSFKEIFNFKSLLDINTTAAEQRYSQMTTTSTIQQIILCFVYFSALLGGFYFNFTLKNIDKIICIFSIAPGFLNLLVTNGKSGFISSVFLFLTGLITSITMKLNVFPKIKLKTIAYLSISAIVSFLFLFLSMMLRIGEINIQVFNIVKNKFISYAFGHLPAFDYWFANKELNKYYFGSKTFYAVSDFLGIVERKQGVYQEFYISGIWKTNVYTAFRPLIEDWGTIGSILVSFLFAIIIGIFYKMLQIKRLSHVGICIVMATYFYIFHSFATTPWAYTTLIITFLLMWIVLKLILKREKILQDG